MEDKNSFFSRVPFAQQKTYLLWLKLTGLFVGLLILSLLTISFKDYLICQDLITQKNTLIGSVNQLDEIVRKKNKLLLQDGKSEKNNNQKLYGKITQYLIEIEESLTTSVHLSSFEYTTNKIEIVGYSDDLKSLSDFIINLQKLPFVKDHDLQQIVKDNKVASHKLAFTVIINL